MRISPQQTHKIHDCKLFEAALGIAEPWHVKNVDFNLAEKTLSIAMDFVAGSRCVFR